MSTILLKLWRWETNEWYEKGFRSCVEFGKGLFMKQLNWAKKPFTYNYSQPSEYLFSLDSVELPWRVAQELQGKPGSQLKVLDLCAGCGVMGFELKYWCPELRHIDFIEVQSEYWPHFERNLEMVGAEPSECRFINKNFLDLAADPLYESCYDIVLCNPPYFRPGTGVYSPSAFKNRCRFLLDASFEQLVDFATRALKVGGECYLLVRDQKQHGLDALAELEDAVAGRCRVERLEPVRGTGLVRFVKEAR